MTVIKGYVFLILASAAITVIDAGAVALEDLATGEQPPSATSSAYDSFNWEYVFKYKGASSVAVDHYWILTAAHVADDGGTGNLVIDGEAYLQQEIVYHSEAADPDGNPKADLALVRYDKPLPGYYLLDNSVPVGSDVVICGYGYPGDVISTRFSAYFTENPAGSRIKRWGTNRIDEEQVLDYAAPYVSTNKGFNVTISTTRSGSGKTPYEAGCNVFDSGGGMFADDGGTWKLTGHMVVRYSSGSQFVGNFAVATAYYVNWIKSVIVDYDTDMDGLPDWWEIEYSGDPVAMERDGDPDDDTFSNYEEWLSDTDPTNGVSCLRLSDLSDTGQLVFESSTNRSYRLESRTDLADTNQSWGVEVDWFIPTSTQTALTVSSSDLGSFYRLRVKLR